MCLKYRENRERKMGPRLDMILRRVPTSVVETRFDGLRGFSIRSFSQGIRNTIRKMKTVKYVKTYLFEIRGLIL